MRIQVFFIILFIFIIWLNYEISKFNKKSNTKTQEFWDKENIANSTRNKDISSIDYIFFPFEKLPKFNIIDDEINYYYNSLLETYNNPMAKLFNLSNTELKLKYGTGNFKHLSECDVNYISLITLLQKLSNSLYHKNYYNESKIILEIAIFDCKSDISDSFILLSNIYKTLNMNNQILKLKSYSKNFNNTKKITALMKNLDKIYNLP